MNLQTYIQITNLYINLHTNYKLIYKLTRKKILSLHKLWRYKPRELKTKLSVYAESNNAILRYRITPKVFFEDKL